MKKNKFFLPILALLFAFGASAFSFASNHKETKSAFAQKWYDFVGTDINDPMDYQLHTGTPPNCPNGSNRCAVKAVQNASLPGDFPDLNDPSIDIRNKP